MININESNKIIIRLLEKNESFLISRLGIGVETYLTYQYLNRLPINFNYLNPLDNNAGIYNVNHTLRNYLDLYGGCIKNSDYLSCFATSIVNEQNFFIQKYNLSTIHSRSLEPFYIINENEKPWTHYLKGKKVLIINPFVESFKKQLKNKFQIFKDPNKKIFLDDQEFIFYKSYQTIAGNHIHEDWYETYNIMCNDIKNLDFDIALLGCGGYGLPLCNFIKMNMNKSAIYIGGGLQLLFGVMGRRWENRDDWKKIIRDNDTKFIRPSGDEIIKNKDLIEGGCYW
jgi:hypothetical protein